MQGAHTSIGAAGTRYSGSDKTGGSKEAITKAPPLPGVLAGGGFLTWLGVVGIILIPGTLAPSLFTFVCKPLYIRGLEKLLTFINELEPDPGNPGLFYFLQ